MNIVRVTPMHSQNQFSDKYLHFRVDFSDFLWYNKEEIDKKEGPYENSVF